MNNSLFLLLIFRIKSAIEFPNLWRLAELQSKHSPQLEKLPVDAHRHLVEALIKAGSHVQDSALREKFLTTVSSATDSFLIIYLSPVHHSPSLSLNLRGVAPQQSLVPGSPSLRTQIICNTRIQVLPKFIVSLCCSFNYNFERISKHMARKAYKRIFMPAFFLSVGGTLTWLPSLLSSSVF